MSLMMIAPFPPPHGGAGKNSQIILERLLGEIEVLRISTSVGQLSHERSLAYHVARSATFLKNALSMLRHLPGKVRRVYIVPDGGLGLFYSLGYVALAALFKKKLYLHYRNYSYIDVEQPLLKALLRMCNASTVHVFLDANMEARFHDRYRAAGTNLIVSNACFLDFDASDLRPPGNGSVTVGYLSNICREKGFYDFVALVEAMNAVDAQVEFCVAGAPVGTQDAAALASLLERFPSVRYLGPVFHDDKRDFYRACDVFVFPTRFSQEAQPNVVWEAMASGAAVVAYDRGSIPWMLRAGGGHVVGRDDDFARCARDVICDWLADRTSLRAVQESGRETYIREREVSLVAYEQLVDSLADRD